MTRKKILITSLILLLALFLRIYKVMSVPISLYWEEVALAYDAWSIAETGKDYHGNAWPLVAFESFGDYKPSGYFYVLAILIKIFGPHDWVVKVPSIWAGVMIVWGAGVLLKMILSNKNTEIKEKISYLVMFLLAINPAMMHLSRVAFETNLALAFLLWGLVFLLKTNHNQIKIRLDWNLLSGMVLLMMSFYTYHSMRVIAPLLGLTVLSGLLLSIKKKNYKFWFFNLCVLSLVAGVCLSPFIKLMGDKQVNNRFNETSIFADSTMIQASNQCRQISGDSFGARIWCHRYWFFGQRMMKNALSHFNFSYLFLTGEENKRHSIGLFGVFYPIDLVPLVMGIYWLLKKWQKEKKLNIFIILATIVVLLPTSLTLAVPHLLRSLPLVIWLTWIVTMGWLEIRKKCEEIKQKFFWLAFLFLYACQLGVHQWYYFNYYARVSGQWWQEGYQEALQYVQLLKKDKPDLPIYITRELGRPSIYYFWYNQINPKEVQKQSKEEKFDQSEFLSYKEVSFIGLQPEKNQIVVLSIEEKQNIDQQKLVNEKEVKSQTGETILIVGEISNEKVDQKSD